MCISADLVLNLDKQTFRRRKLPAEINKARVRLFLFSSTSASCIYTVLENEDLEESCAGVNMTIQIALSAAECLNCKHNNRDRSRVVLLRRRRVAFFEDKKKASRLPYVCVCFGISTRSQNLTKDNIVS